MDLKYEVERLKLVTAEDECRLMARLRNDLAAAEHSRFLSALESIWHSSLIQAVY
jgi:hypothetical protein